MPFQSIYPFIASVGILIAAIGIAVLDANPAPGIHLKLGTTLVGGAIMFIGIYLWALEGAPGYHIHPEPEKNSAASPKQEAHK